MQQGELLPLAELISTFCQLSAAYRLDAGAAPVGEFGSYHAGPVDRRSKLAEDVVLIYPYAIFVNQSAYFLVSPQIPDLLMARVPTCRRWGRALSSPVRS